MAKTPQFKVTPKTIKDIGKLALLGATLAQMADFLEITEGQLSGALAREPDLNQARKRGGLHADAEVAASLFKRACGYTAIEEKAFSYMGDVEIAQIRKHIPADVSAIKFWLKNRQREMWREAPEIQQGEMHEPWEIELV